MYADDTVTVCTDRNKEIAVKNADVAFNHIQSWCALNNIHVNKKKTRHMMVGSKKMSVDIIM